MAAHCGHRIDHAARPGLVPLERPNARRKARSTDYTKTLSAGRTLTSEGVELRKRTVTHLPFRTRGRSGWHGDRSDHLCSVLLWREGRSPRDVRPRWRIVVAIIHRFL